MRKGCLGEVVGVACRGPYRGGCVQTVQGTLSRGECVEDDVREEF